MIFSINLANHSTIWCTIYTAQRMKFSIKDFFSKCDQIRRKLRISPHLLKKFLMENFIFCAVLSVPDHSSGLNDLPENNEDPTTTTTTFSFLYYYFKQFFKRFQEFKL